MRLKGYVMSKKIARVFPRITSATPCDELAFYDVPPRLLNLDVDECHVSVTFTYDVQKAEYLADQWSVLGVPVKLGGPAYGIPAGEFTPGMYMKPGYVITSRGCPNKCWFCRVPKVQGQLIELPITEGWNVTDDNILACSESHIKAVFDMLAKQKERPVFSGGLEAKLLKPWHVELLQKVKAQQLFFAYDTPDDYEPMVQAGKLLCEAGFTIKARKVFCYVLIGYPGDTMEKAEQRCIDTLKAGFVPFAMLWKDEQGHEDKEWSKFRRLWCRPALIAKLNPELFI